MKNKKNIEISIVVPFYNERASLARLLDSFETLSQKISHEIIMVDNDSSDLGVDIVKKYQQKNKKIILVTEKRRGIGRARKTGVAHARGKIVASTDADVILPKFWLEKISEKIIEKKYIGVVGRYYFFDKGATFNLLFRSAMTFFDIIHRLIFGSFAFRGLNFAIRSDVYEKSGGFNPKISALEDVDLSLRVKKFGKVCYYPGLLVGTSYRRFEGRFLKQLVKRVRAYFYRVLLRTEKESEWDVVR